MNLKDRAQQPEGGVYTGFVPDQKPYQKLVLSCMR
jgi:hypothetical protein